jgi:hypothetical protein
MILATVKHYLNNLSIDKLLGIRDYIDQLIIAQMMTDWKEKQENKNGLHRDGITSVKSE